jgi:hypothetical protein
VNIYLDRGLARRKAYGSDGHIQRPFYRSVPVVAQLIVA